MNRLLTMAALSLSFSIAAHASTNSSAFASSFENAIIQADNALSAGQEWVVLANEKDATAVLMRVETSELEAALSASASADGDPIPFARLKGMGFYVASFSAGSAGAQAGIRFGRALEIGIEGNYFTDWGLRAPGVEYGENETESVMAKREGQRFAAFAQVRIRTDGEAGDANGIYLKARIVRASYSLNLFSYNHENGDRTPLELHHVRGHSIGFGAGRYWSSGFALEIGMDFRLKSNFADGVGASTNGRFPNLSLIIPLLN